MKYPETFLSLTIQAKVLQQSTEPKVNCLDVPLTPLISYPTLLPISHPAPTRHVLSCVRLFAASWTVSCQAPLPMEFSKKEYWSRLPFPIPGDLPAPGTEPHLMSLLHWRGDLLPLRYPGSPLCPHHTGFFSLYQVFKVNSSLLNFALATSATWNAISPNKNIADSHSLYDLTQIPQSILLMQPYSNGILSECYLPSYSRLQYLEQSEVVLSNIY